MTATAETTEVDSVDGPELKTGGTTNINTTTSTPKHLEHPEPPPCGTIAASVMAPKRAAAYIGLASVFGAWLASAAGISMRAPQEIEQPPPVPTSGTETLAADVQSQTMRLRERLASSPSPKEPLRNPFVFATREPRPQRAPSSSASVPVPAGTSGVPEPPLTLVGVAERQTPTATVRTAMITADSDELFMLAEGDVLGGRYRVKSGAADAAELTDLVTGVIRRLTLR